MFFYFQFADDEILKIIRAHINKAHGHNEISVRMIKICDDAIIEPLSLIYKNSIENGTFPEIWKKSNIVPVSKKEINRLSIIIDLFHCYPYLAKYLREFYLIHYLIIFQKIISFVNISLGFEPNDSCVYQLLSTVDDIYASFDCNRSMLEAYFWTCLKHLTKFGMMSLFTR